MGKVVTIIFIFALFLGIMMKSKIIGILFLLLACVFTMLGQQKDKKMVYIERADQMIGVRTPDKDYQRLIGDVLIRHDSTYFYCDSAHYYENERSFDAFSRVHIIVNDSVEIFSDLLYYDGHQRYAEFFDNVRLVDDSTMLETDYLTYDRTAHRATYPRYGVTTRGDKKLVSRVGHYRDDIKEFSFFSEVEVTNPDYQMYTDTLYYNTNVERMWFYGPTTIVNDDNVLEGERGYYLVDDRVSFIDKNPVLYNTTQRAVSDSIYYDAYRGFAKMMSDVDMIDSSYSVILKGQYVELWEKLGKSFATDKAQSIYYDDDDSLFLHSDTLFFYFKTDYSEEEKLMAYYNVRFYRSDMQGLSDSLVYYTADSTLRMRGNPVLWADDSQLTADSINIIMENRRIDSIYQYSKAFIISQDSIEGFNQIKGNDIVSCFKGGRLNKVNVVSNAESIYWLREDDTSLIGINVSKSADMTIILDRNAISRIKYYRAIDETLFPEQDLKESSRYLDGFIWESEIRPHDKDDIFRVVERKAPEKALDPKDEHKGRRHKQ